MPELVIFAGGLCVGSFLNVLIYRLPRNLPFVGGRSLCPRCKKRLPWYDNIPLLSFILLGGKCRFCKSQISWRYPLVELLTGILFLLAYTIGLPWINFLFIAGLIVIFFVDLEHQIIPDQVISALIFVYFFSHLILNSKFLILNSLPTAIFSALFFLLLFLITRGKGMGFGDVKFAFLIGLSFGFPKAIFAIWLAFLTGAIIGVILLLVGKVKFGRPIPFGPFLAGGSLLILFLGDNFLWFLGKYF